MPPKYNIAYHQTQDRIAQQAVSKHMRDHQRALDDARAYYNRSQTSGNGEWADRAKVRNRLAAYHMKESNKAWKRHLKHTAAIAKLQDTEARMMAKKIAGSVPRIAKAIDRERAKQSRKKTL
jgi:hypothetical protein